MYPVLSNNALPALNGTNGLNGWFGRLIKKLVSKAFDLVSSIPIVGGVFKSEIAALQQKVENIMDNSFFQRTIPDYEPTASEAAILENWADTKLNPFYKLLVTQLSDAFKLTDLDAQLVQINDVMQKMCIVKKYFETSETTGLSADAVLSRNELINQIFLPVESIITKSVEKYDTVLQLTPYTFSVTNSNTASLAPLVARLIVAQSFTCQKYVDTNKPNIATKTPVTSPLLPISDLPIKITTPKSTDTVIMPAIPEKEDQTVDDATAKGDSIFTLRNGLFGLGLLFAIRELTKKKKKKK